MLQLSICIILSSPCHYLSAPEGAIFVIKSGPGEANKNVRSLGGAIIKKKKKERERETELFMLRRQRASLLAQMVKNLPAMQMWV